MSTPALPLKQLQELLDTAVAVARSEVGVASMRAGAGMPYDAWPEMDALVKLLDRLTPGWELPA
ncbi:hypothetical protein [Roseococcus sp.]|uniref:hypothetical protein n=1 Tax=Roseococcus sp. TaxID=2109646 RepID=UPI003BAC7BA8